MVEVIKKCNPVVTQRKSISPASRRPLKDNRTELYVLRTNEHVVQRVK